MVYPVKADLLRLLLGAIQCEHSLYNEETSPIHGVIQSLAALECYEQNFERPFLEATGDYYR